MIFRLGFISSSQSSWRWNKALTKYHISKSELSVWFIQLPQISIIYIYIYIYVYACNIYIYIYILVVLMMKLLLFSEIDAVNRVQILDKYACLSYFAKSLSWESICIQQLFLQLRVISRAHGILLLSYSNRLKIDPVSNPDHCVNTYKWIVRKSIRVVFCTFLFWS